MPRLGESNHYGVRVRERRRALREARRRWTLHWLCNALGYAALIVAGCVMVFTLMSPGVWVVLLVLPLVFAFVFMGLDALMFVRNRPVVGGAEGGPKRCSGCLYNIDGLEPGGVCPECGRQLPGDGEVVPRGELMPATRFYVAGVIGIGAAVALMVWVGVIVV